MTLTKFAWNNVIRDKRSYIAYFISSMFSVFIFFSFAVSMFHPNLAVIEAGSSLFLALLCGNIIVYIFSFLFLAYSMNAFLQRRKKQFGLITLIGASKKQLNYLIFLENMTIGVGAIIGGVVLGILFERFFLLIEESMIKDMEFPMYIPVKAICVTVILFGFLFLAVSASLPHLIRSEEITRLLKADKIGEKEEDKKKIWSCFGVLTFIGCLWLVFSKDMISKAVRESSLYQIILLGLVMIMTYTFFRIVVGNLLRLLQKTKFYYKKTNLLLYSDLIGKVRENAQMMFLTCILYAVSFIAIVGFTEANQSIDKDTEKKIPYAHCLSVDKETKQTKKVKSLLEDTLKTQPGFKEAVFELRMLKDSHQKAYLSETDYNEIAKLLHINSIDLNQNEVYLCAGNAKNEKTLELSSDDISFYSTAGLKSSAADIAVKGTSNQILLITGAYSKYIVLDDLVYSKLCKIKKYQTEKVYAYQVDNWKTNRELNHKLMTSIEKSNRVGIPEYRYNQRGYWYEIDKLSGNLMQYVAILLSFLFMIASASMIYFRIYTNFDKEVEKYKGIVKMGLSKKEMLKVINKELVVLLFLPFIIAILYMWGTVIAVGHSVQVSMTQMAFLYNILFVLAEVTLYQIVKRIYQKKILKGVFES